MATRHNSMLLPKPRGRKRHNFIPVLPHESLGFILGSATPDDRKALAQIIETTDLVRLEDGTEFLLTPATPALLDRLAAFDAESEDREWDDGDEIEQDDDSDSDNALDWSRDGPLGAAYVDDGERETTDGRGGGRPPEGSRKSYEVFVERKRKVSVGPGAGGPDVIDEAGTIYRTVWHDKEYLSIRPEGRDEVERMRRAVGTPSRRGRWS